MKSRVKNYLVSVLNIQIQSEQTHLNNYNKIIERILLKPDKSDLKFWQGRINGCVNRIALANEAIDTISKLPVNKIKQ